MLQKALPCGYLGCDSMPADEGVIQVMQEERLRTCHSIKQMWNWSRSTG